MSEQRWSREDEGKGPGDEPTFEEEPVFPDDPVAEPRQRGGTPADEPAFAHAPDPAFEEPVFGESDADDLYLNEPAFPESTVGAVPTDRKLDATEMLAGGGAVTASSGRPVPDVQDEPHRRAPEEERPYVPKARRLGRTGPFWIAGAVGALLILLVIWFAFRGDGEDAVADAPIETPVVVEGAAGTTALPTEADLTPAAEEVPTPEPAPVLEVGQRVVVSNTGNTGIRLRDQPGLGGVTLAIYEEGDPFVLVNPGGDYVEYPVEADGYRWYRIQVADNPEEDLTGWAAADFLAPVE